MIPIYNNWLSSRNFDIAICIPTKNEEDTISNVLSIVDEWLSRYYPLQRLIILNIDSKSTYSILSEDAKCLVTKSLGLDNVKQTEDFFINSYIVDEKWMKILTFSINFMLEKDISPINIAKFLYPIFVLKVYFHFYRIENLSDETAEFLIQKQALLFYENRKNILDSLKILG